MIDDLQKYLKPTFFLDYDTKELATLPTTVCTGSNTPTEKAIALYYAVRDQIKYDPYDLKYSRTAMKASSVLKKKSGYCVSKAVLLAAVGRQQQIPCPHWFCRCNQPSVHCQIERKDGHGFICLSWLHRNVSQ